MCLVMKENQFERVDQRMEAMVTLNDLQNFLMNSMSEFEIWRENFEGFFYQFSCPGPFQNFSLINAKVPILRFRDASNKIEIDLNYNNCIGVRNTQLLNSYSQCKLLNSKFLNYVSTFIFEKALLKVSWRICFHSCIKLVSNVMNCEYFEAVQ